MQLRLYQSDRDELKACVFAFSSMDLRYSQDFASSLRLEEDTSMPRI